MSVQVLLVFLFFVIVTVVLLRSVFEKDEVGDASISFSTWPVFQVPLNKRPGRVYKFQTVVKKIK